MKKFLSLVGLLLTTTVYAQPRSGPYPTPVTAAQIAAAGGVTNGQSGVTFIHPVLIVTNGNSTNFALTLTNISGRFVTDYSGLDSTNLDGVAFTFSKTPGDQAYGSILINPSHSGPASNPRNVEFQITSSGNIMNGVGYSGGNGAWQLGSYDHSFWYWKGATNILTKANALGYGIPITEEAYWTDANTNAIAYYPGFVTLVTAPGKYQFAFFPNIADQKNFDITTIRPYFRLYYETNDAVKGAWISGGVRYDKSNGSISTNALDFGAYETLDLTCVAANVFISGVTNSFESPTNREPRTVFIRSGGYTVTVTATNFNGWINTNMIPGQMLRFQIESLGAGNSNKNILSEQVLNDPTFSFDPDFFNFSARAGVTNYAVNTLFTAIRSAGLWNTNGFMYPMLTGNSSNSVAVNGFNITNFDQVFSGTNYFTNGYRSDGLSGFADTGFNPNTQSWTATNVTIYAYISTNNTPVNLSRPIGSTGVGGRLGIIYNTSTGWGNDGINDATSGNTSLAITGPHCAIIRTNSATQIEYGDAGISTSATATTAVPNQTLYIGARNSATPGPGNFYSGTVKFVIGIPQGISQSQWTTLTNAVEQYQISLGRQGVP